MLHCSRNCSLECTVNQVLPAGDHHLVLLRVEALNIHDAVAPLVFHTG